ncbi:MAG: hypothetical protein ACRC1H_20855, partial [Caldilineaceae bacterium]
MTTNEREYDEIDLRHSLGAIGRWWREIVLIAVFSGLVVGGAFWLLARTRTPVYSASADVAILRTATDVTFDERFTTQSETVAGTTIASRRNALFALALSPSLAQAVIA